MQLRTDGPAITVVRLDAPEPWPCPMCGKLDEHHWAVPWYCGPVLDGESEGGYKACCRPCHDRWAKWNDAMQYWGA